jgi:hypothetical protein
MGDLTALTYVTECNAVVGIVAQSPQNPELEHESTDCHFVVADNNEVHEGSERIPP